MDRIAVLTSGGLDSAVLVADLARDAAVFPVYVACGLVWEAEERRALGAYLAALNRPNLCPLVELALPAGALYGEHWSTSGRDVPDAESPDSAVFLPGRNVLLIGLAAVWCSTHAADTIAIGSLDENPFPDATPRFFESYGRLLSEALDHAVRVIAPYRGLRKAELIRRHAGLPLELSLSCMQPRDGRHCGACNKCAERRRAFAEAGVPDRTPYDA